MTGNSLVAKSGIPGASWNPSPPPASQQHSPWPGCTCAGFLYIQAKEYEQGIAAFQTALRGRVSDAAAWEGLASCYHQLGRFTAAFKVRGSIQGAQGKEAADCGSCVLWA